MCIPTIAVASLTMVLIHISLVTLATRPVASGGGGGAPRKIFSIGQKIDAYGFVRLYLMHSWFMPSSERTCAPLSRFWLRSASVRRHHSRIGKYSSCVIKPVNCIFSGQTCVVPYLLRTGAAVPSPGPCGCRGGSTQHPSDGTTTP